MSDPEEELDPAQVPEEEAVPEEPKNFLKLEQIQSGLSQISRTHDGASYAYTSLNLEEKELEELGDLLRQYSHLRFINLSKN